MRRRSAISKVTWILSVVLLFGCTEGFAAWYDTYDFSGKGVIAYWPLDGNADDVSGNGLDGTPTNCSESSLGRFGSCYDFSGVAGSGSSRIQVPQHPTCTSLTVSLWVNLDTFPTWSSPDHGSMTFFSRAQGYSTYNLQALLDHNDDVDGQPYFAHLLGSGNPSNVVTSSSLTAGLGTWHHLAATEDALKLRIYLDGVLVQEVDSNGPPHWDSGYTGTGDIVKCCVWPLA